MKERLACIVVARNLGDAVIQADFVSKLATRGFAERYIVWTRPQVSFLFSSIPNCQVIPSQFPVGTNKQFDLAALVRLVRAALAIRKLRPSVTIDLIGDFRERILARLVGSQPHLHIGWPKEHSFVRQIRNPFGVGQPLLTVPPSCRNVYKAYDLFLDALTYSDSLHRAREPESARSVVRIGLHPFASQDCRLWPAERWRTLADELVRRGARVVVFGSPSEREKLEQVFLEQLARVEVFTGSLQEFESAVAGLDVLIGLDSFAVHMAQRHGIRSVVINSANDPTLWSPPGATVIHSSGGCAFHPCFNIPRCQNTSFEYACIRSISVQDVLAAVFR